MLDDENGGCDMAKDTKLTVMVEEPLIDQLGKAAFDADVTKSDLVRACIHLALPILKSTPSLIHIVPTLPMKGNKVNAG